MIRVGTHVYDRKGEYKDPEVEGFLPIVCLTKSTAYGSLSPYVQLWAFDGEHLAILQSV